MTDCRVAPEALGIERLPGGHVRIWRDGKKIMLHRWIVEKVEGRTLAPYPEEVVRHLWSRVRPCWQEHRSILVSAASDSLRRLGRRHERLG